MIYFRCVAFVFCFLFAVTAVMPAYAVKPKTIVGIVLTRFYPEWLDMYAGELGNGGFRRISGGSRRLEADYGYMYSQSGTDHATLVTGVMPYEHGIVCHTWYDRVKKELCKNTGKENTPENMEAVSAGAYMRMASLFSKVFSVAMKSEDAVMGGGSYANGTLWFDDISGKIVSSDFHGGDPVWLSGFNERLKADSLVKTGWMPVERERQFKSRTVNKVAAKASADFFYDLGHLKTSYNSYAVLNATPYANDIVTDLAVEVLEKERFGADNETDLLMVTYSSLDYMNRDFPVDSKEFRDLVLRLDKNIECLLNRLDKLCGEDNYTVFLTVSEARELLPVDLARYRIQSNYFSIYRAVALLRSYMKLIYGEGAWIVSYDSGQIYLDRELIQQKGLNLAEVQRTVADFLTDFEGVQRVVTASELNIGNPVSGTAAFIAGSYCPKRSGDVLFALKQTWIPLLMEREDEYNRYSKRHRVPLFFFGAGSGWISAESCNMTDVLPTLFGIMGKPSPSGVSGKSLLY